MPFFEFLDDGGGTDVQHAGGVTNPAGIHGCINDLLCDGWELTEIKNNQAARCSLGMRPHGSESVICLAVFSHSVHYRCLDSVGNAALGLSYVLTILGVVWCFSLVRIE